MKQINPGRTVSKPRRSSSELRKIRFRELYFLGTYPQFLAWALYPLVLFCFLQLARRPSRGYFLGAVLSMAGVITAHNISAMLFAPVLGTYAVGLAIAYRKKRAWISLSGAVACAALLSAAFWLPALSEMGYTRVKVLTQGHFDVNLHFLRLADLVAEIRPLDDRAANPTLPFTLGRWHLVLAAAGALTIFLRSRSPLTRRHLVGALCVVGVGVFMMLPYSLPVWRAVPLIGFAEYPWRVYGVVFLGSSLLAGAGVTWFARIRPLQWAAASVAVSGLLLSVAVYQFPRPFLAVSATPDDYLTYETTFRAIGTTGADEFLGRWVEASPRESAMRPGQDRVALVDTPNGVLAEVLDTKARSLQLAVQAQAPATLTLAQFYFPGWRAWVDGVPVEVRPAPHTGLIQMDVAAGDHRVWLAYSGTLVQSTASLLSLGGLLGTVVLLWRMRSPAVAPDIIEHDTWAEAAIVGTVPLVALLLGVLWIGSQTSWFRLASPPDQALPAAHQVQLPINEAVTLIGYDLLSTSVTQGQELHARMYWQAAKPLDRDYSSFVKLVAGPQQREYARSDRQHPGSIPTTTWTSARYVVDDQYVLLPADTPPVALKVVTGLYRQDNLEWLGAVELPELVHVSQSVDLKQIQMSLASAGRFGDNIRLLGHRVEKSDDGVLLTLFWRADACPEEDYQVFIHAMDAAGNQVAQADGPPVDGLYPASTWLPGQVIVDTHRVPLPTEDATTLQMGLYDLDSMTRLRVRLDGEPSEDRDAVDIPIGSYL